MTEAAGGKTLPVSSRLIRSLPHPDRTASLWSVRFTPAGHLFAAGYPSGVVQIHDPKTGQEVRRVESPRGYRGSADYALAPADFRTLYVPMDGRKVVRTPEDKKQPFRIEYQGEFLVWDLTTGKAKAALKPAPGRGPIEATLSPDGRRLVTVERAGHAAGQEPPADEVRLYDLATGKSRKLGDGYGAAAFSPDGRRIYLGHYAGTGRASAALKVFDADGKELATLAEAAGQSFGWLRPSDDGKRLVVQLSKGRINEPATLKVFDLATNKELASFPSGGDYPFMSPRLSPDGRLLAAGDYDGNVTVWDVAKRGVVRRRTFKGMAPGLTLAFSPDGKRLAVPMRVKTDNDRTRDPDPLDFPQPRVFLFDLTNGGDPEEIVCPHGWAGDVAFSADGNTLAVGGAGAVHLFDVSAKR